MTKSPEAPCQEKRGESSPGNRALQLRPHHVLCSIGFEGKGYSDVFTANMARIVDGRLRAEAGGEEIIEIIAEADAICGPCPLREGSGCEREEMISALDQRHGAALSLAPGDLLTWAEATRRARERVAPDDLDQLCDGCRWLAMGMCKSALERLKST